MSFWSGPGGYPFPPEEDAAQTAWWDGLSPAYRERWAPLLARLDARGRVHFHRLRRGMRAEFRKPEGTPDREAEENAAEERLHQRVALGVARMVTGAQTASSPPQDGAGSAAR